ncbi:MAG: phosphoenolpyruvate--protein phosphotransferase [Anaerolineae bacterium]|nr:phosphoenolpyruvate--protein phosphotransferase [Anaerolineae bacterium]
MLQGIAASRGIAIGPAYQFRRASLTFERCTIDAPATEWLRCEDALETARQQIIDIAQHIEAESGAAEAEIFQAHLLMLEDPELLETVRETIDQQYLNAEAAFSDAAEVYAQKLESLSSDYLKSRAGDVRDITERVLRILIGAEETSVCTDMFTPSIVVAEDLTPSDTVLMDKTLVLGFCTAGGGATSHTAILARGLGLPAVVGIGPAALTIPDGATLILDGAAGTVMVSPDSETIDAYRIRQETVARVRAEARTYAHAPAITRDGHRVEVVANIGNVESANAALDAGAEGVGLLRTEFLYLERHHLPDEEEQYRAYRAIVDVFGDLPVVLRTLDVGGDKDLPYLDLAPTANPFLGQRAIRLCLARPHLFKPQLRAVLRAGAGRNLKLMFPMVATLDEVREARAILEVCRAELRAEKQAYAEQMEIGIMIEVPSAAIMAHQFAAEVDFFSIGTNDLSQYTMAADRTDAQVARLADAFQPAVLHLIRTVIDAAHSHGRWVGLCGELAGEPLAIPILLGLGLDEFSMNPPAIPTAKQVIRALDLDEARALATEALTMESPKDIRDLVWSRVTAARVG